MPSPCALWPAVVASSAAPTTQGAAREEPLPIPLAAEAVAQAVGLLLEFAPTEVATAPPHALHALALLVHLIALLLRASGAVLVAAGDAGGVGGGAEERGAAAEYTRLRAR